ncbi:MAG TPA: flagellar biosynthetic protein FliO [Alphaproteobacteria bacterium]|nr:flagellar biosynthetic protein FliO [Alphaproteobacteria bacterium]HRJ67113.1 flagellar biosynthetic protein FliO [Alphaproteobacteria bacterium]
METAVATSGIEMYLKVIFAFVFVMGLMFAFSWLVKKLGLATPGMAAGAKRRLKVVEFLPLDTRRRLVLVRRDDREHLIVIGGNGGDVVVERDIAAPAEKNAEIVDMAQQKDAQNAG